MDAESFSQLALRVIAGEADSAEAKALQSAIVLDPARQAEFEQMRIVHDVLRTTGPLADAVYATEPALPAYRVNELRTAVRQHFGPAAARKSRLSRGSLFLRWFLAGGSATVAALVVAFFVLSDQIVEVGLYQVNQVRGEDGLAAPDLNARLVTFERDEPFDQWQKTLAWNEHAKVWVDNEKDLLHVLSRNSRGELTDITRPLASGVEEQRVQIAKVVASLKR